MLALAAGSASAVSEVTNIFTEGFNELPFSSPYVSSWGAQFGVTAPGVVTNDSSLAVEGVGFAALNNNRAIDPPVNIIGHMQVELGTVAAEGVTYTFSGDFSWRYGTAASAAELKVNHGSHSGFKVDTASPASDGSDFYFTMAQTNWATHSFSYTTTASDVGKPIAVVVRLADDDNVAGLTQLLTDNWIVTRETTVRTEPLVIDVRADGLIYYYNPANDAAGYVANDGVITDGGITIGLCAYETMAYTFGIVTNGAATGVYRVSAIDFSGADQTASGNGIGTTATRNILTNSTTATLVDIVYDGTDFWFLADDGKVFQNSSTNAAFDFGATVVATYDSLTLSETRLQAGATAADGFSKVLEYDGGTVATLVDQAGAVGGTTWVAGLSDDAAWYHCRAQGYTYEGTGTWIGGAPGSATPLRGFAASKDGIYMVHSAGYLYFNGWNWANNMIQQTIMNNAVDLAVVQVSYVVQAFPAIADPVGPNLIPNGDFTSSSSVSPATSPNNTWNILGSFGDWPGATGCTAVADNWAHYYADPDGLVPAVGTPHVINGTGELDGTFYLDTHYSALDHITLNSVMNYRNGMKSEDVLNGVTIDSGKTYRFTVNAVGWERPSAIFTAALTDASGSAVTNPANAIADALLTDSLADWDGTQTVDVDGADLLAAGQVNVIFDQVNPVDIPGFPGSVAPGDVSNAELVSQIKVYSVSLAELLSAGVGDVNKDGVVNQDDVDLANSYLDGSIDGGDDAATRQADLIAQGMTAEDALAYLNLTDFDVDGDGTFDADDVVAIEDMLGPPVLQVAMSGATMDFEWNSSSSKEYSLESRTSLQYGEWALYNDGSNTYGSISGSETGTNYLTGVLSDGPVRFFRVLEGKSPISYLSVIDGSFEQAGSGWSACMASWNSTLSGGYALLGGSGHMTTTPDDGTWQGLMSNLGTIHQDLDTVNSNDTLTVIFYGGRAKAGVNTDVGGVFNCTLRVGSSEKTVQADTTLLANDTWQAYTNTWTATETGTLTLEFSNDSGKPWIDAISDVKRVEPTP
jgi:hypothetical protein